MAVTFTEAVGQNTATERTVSFKFNFTLSGSYSTGGETINFTTTPFTKMHIRALSQIRDVQVVSNNGAQYQFLAGSNLTNCKLKAYSSAVTELGAGAYAAGYTSDAPYMIVEYLQV